MSVLDFDLVKVGDGCSLGNDCYVIGHIYQQGRLGFANVEVGSHCTLGALTQVMLMLTL